MRTKPIAPRSNPNANPDRISRQMTRDQSRSVNSPSANARITRVAACEPEFPPDEMTRGTNRASTTACAIWASKKLIAVAVSISPRKSMMSQLPRFRIMRVSAICMNGSSSTSTPPIFWMSSVASASATSSTSSTVTMPIMMPDESVTGKAVRSSRRKIKTAVSWSSAALRATNLLSINSATRVSAEASRMFLMRMSSIKTSCSSTT